VRRKNFIKDFAADAGRSYDSGNYPIALDKALQIVGYQNCGRAAASAPAVAILASASSYIEICALGRRS
jgi:hypothetical protein